MSYMKDNLGFSTKVQDSYSFMRFNSNPTHLRKQVVEGDRVKLPSINLSQHDRNSNNSPDIKGLHGLKNSEEIDDLDNFLLNNQD